MIELSGIRIETTKQQEEALLKKIASKLRIKQVDIVSYIILRKSIDARKKPILYFEYHVAVSLSAAAVRKLKSRHVSLTPYKKNTYTPLRTTSNKPTKKPVVIGAGPAGIFCTYVLALAGLEPILLERGKDVYARREAVYKFWETGELDEKTNVSFGEGGAGTFSDGKLNSGIKDTSGRIPFILNEFVSCGADDHILYDHKPHVGSDVLMTVLYHLRQKIIELGARVCFEHCVKDFIIENNTIIALETDGNEYPYLETDRAILCIGHSARDTYRLLSDKHIHMEAKDFAVGYRVEHPTKWIDRALYGPSSSLENAAYKLTASINGKRAYSFCMCPGGYVVHASDKAGLLCINGMSNQKRDSGNANSAIIMPVTFDGKTHSFLDAICLQEEIEKKAWQLADGAIPQQLFSDYKANKASSTYGSFSSCVLGKHAFTNLRGLLPTDMEETFIDAMDYFNQRMDGFSHGDTIVSGIETRTSSPVRINRDERLLSNVAGLYPCGEGAGYAGGIISAAVDGMKVAEKIIREINEY